MPPGRSVAGNGHTMALLQISEPGASPDPHQRRIAVGAYQDGTGRWWTAQLFGS